LAAGYHVLAEKPLAFAPGEGEQLIAAAEQAQVFFGCCDCRFLGQGSVEVAKDLIASGRLGEIYRITWRARSQRSRSGIEWQPESPWFLKRSVSGGGIVMDWAPYDLATIHDLIQPNAVTIQHSWMQQVATALPEHLNPADVDVETHAGARLVYATPAGDIAVDYERSACVHGPEQQHFFIEGSHGSIEFIWTWDQKIILHTDLNMQTNSEILPIVDDGLHCHDRPLVYFQRAIAGQPHAATLGWQTWFNYAVLRGLYDVAATNTPWSLAMPAAHQAQESVSGAIT
jgi:predicted dehydrogenase